MTDVMVLSVTRDRWVKGVQMGEGGPLLHLDANGYWPGLSGPLMKNLDYYVPLSIYHPGLVSLRDMGPGS